MEQKKPQENDVVLMIIGGDELIHFTSDIINVATDFRSKIQIELKKLPAPNALKGNEKYDDKDRTYERAEKYPKDRFDIKREIEKIFADSEDIIQNEQKYLEVMSEVYKVRKEDNDDFLSYAITLLEEAGDLCPDRHEWSEALGLLLFEKNRFDEAKEYLKHAIDAGCDAVLFHYGKVLIEDGDYQEACEVLKEYEDTYCEDEKVVKMRLLDTYKEIADASFALDQYEDAIKYYVKYSELKDDFDEHIWFMREWCEEKIEKIEDKKVRKRIQNIVEENSKR